MNEIAQTNTQSREERGRIMEAIARKTDEANDRRMEELERRVFELEERARQALSEGEKARSDKEKELLVRYGEYVDKTVASRILGVTRVTVYAMLADGRILGGCEGRRVDVRSIARYLTTRQPGAHTRGGRAEKAREAGKDEGKKTEGNGHECA